jgi:hypothetical protein
MSKFNDDLLRYAKELGIDEAVIYPTQPTAVKPTVPGQPVQPGGFDLNAIVLQHPKMQPLVVQQQKLSTQMAQASAEALKDVMATIQQQAAGKAPPPGTNPAGAVQVAPTVGAPMH